MDTIDSFSTTRGHLIGQCFYTIVITEINPGVKRKEAKQLEVGETKRRGCVRKYYRRTDWNRLFGVDFLDDTFFI